MFYHSIPKNDIATQVAGLLNSFNGLGSTKTAFGLLGGSTKYLVETEGKFVIGAVGIDRQGYTFTEIKHLVVRPEHQSRGIGKYLVRQAMKAADTKMLYATVREGNEASLYLFEKLGFIRSNGYETGDHNVILLVRATPSWEKEKPCWKSTLSRLTNSNPFHRESNAAPSSVGTDTARLCLEHLGIPTESPSTPSTSPVQVGSSVPSTSKT